MNFDSEILEEKNLMIIDITNNDRVYDEVDNNIVIYDSIDEQKLIEHNTREYNNSRENSNSSDSEVLNLPLPEMSTDLKIQSTNQTLSRNLQINAYLTPRLSLRQNIPPPAPNRNRNVGNYSNIRTHRDYNFRRNLYEDIYQLMHN